MFIEILLQFNNHPFLNIYMGLPSTAHKMLYHPLSKFSKISDPPLSLINTVKITTNFQALNTINVK
jgi:hypothetical protein